MDPDWDVKHHVYPQVIATDYPEHVLHFIIFPFCASTDQNLTFYLVEFYKLKMLTKTSVDCFAIIRNALNTVLCIYNYQYLKYYSKNCEKWSTNDGLFCIYLVYF